MSISNTVPQPQTSSSWRTLPIASPAQTRRAILRSLATREYRWWLICACFAQTITVIAQLLPAQIVGWSINQLSTSHASHARSTMLWLLFFTNVLLVIGVILFFSKYILLSNFARNTRIKLVHNALNIPANIIEHAGTGDLLSRDSSDIEKIIEAVENLIGNLIGFVLYLVIILILATITSPLLTLAALAGAISYYPGLQWYRHRSHSAYLQESAANSSIYQQLAITVDGAHTIDTFMLHDLRRESLFRALVNHFQKTLMVTFIRQVFIFSIELGLFLPILGWLLFSFWGYQHHWFTLGAITTIGIYFFQMIYPIESLLYWSDQAQSAFSSFSRVTGIEIIAQPNHPVTLSHLHNEQPAVLIAHKVSFHYPETQRPALTEIDLTIHPGERIAIVGPSGAGKTTLAKLLSGFDFPTSGYITFAGVPLHEIPPAQLRRYISLVTQEHHVFIGTIIENVRMARSDASDDEVLLALETVGAMQWVEQVGMNTLVGDGRYELSAAQAQHIALARVALADPHIVILDEATSLLDPQSAYNAEYGLADIIASRTVITIAHRLYSAQVADRIAVMEHGTITELGTHQELLADNKTYARLWSAWNFH